MLGRAGRAGRERLGAQLPANTRAHSISRRPSDTTSHSHAPAKKRAHLSPPCHRVCARRSLLRAAPLLALRGTEDVVFKCRKLLGFMFRDSHTLTNARARFWP